MPTVINNIEFFTDNLINTRSHKRTAYIYDDKIQEKFRNFNIYTSARNKNIVRLKKN